MFALIKMLHNQKEDKFHPILYFDAPLPGPIDQQKVIRYKSKGHHTTGFTDRKEAALSIDAMKPELEKKGQVLTIEFDEKDDIQWDGEDIPTDIQLRGFPVRIS